jgi:hypothetical protein
MIPVKLDIGPKAFAVVDLGERGEVGHDHGDGDTLCTKASV